MERALGMCGMLVKTTAELKGENKKERNKLDCKAFASTRAERSGRRQQQMRPRVGAGLGDNSKFRLCFADLEKAAGQNSRHQAVGSGTVSLWKGFG